MDYMPIAIALVTGVTTIAVVWWQERSSSRKVTEILRTYAERIQSAEGIRDLILQPAEGRWSYYAQFDEFFGVKSAEDDSGPRFVSRGIASFQWNRGVYNILLGYSNRDADGKKISASVNKGTLRPNNLGQIQVGDTINMTYVHRVGLRYRSGDVTVDASDPKEDSYIFEICSISYTDSGTIRGFDCTLKDHVTSTGNMSFTREF